MRVTLIYLRRMPVVLCLLVILPLSLFARGSSDSAQADQPAPAGNAIEEGAESVQQPSGINPPLDVEYLDEVTALRQGYAVATFAGGCFWCMEGPYDVLEGVISTTPGYSGGHVINPRYEEVVSGTTGHTEVVQVVFDPQVISYEQLLEVFWVNIDPLDAGGQFCDRGSQYRSEIFYHDEHQRTAALASRQMIDEAGILPAPIVTEVTALDVFYPAEQYHHDYYRRNPIRYRFYRTACGRDARLAQLWGERVR